MNWLKKAHEWGNRHEWILILLVVVVILRLPSLVTPNFYGDEEIYFVMGRAWREGVPLYAAMFDHKPPLIYVLAGLFPTVVAFRSMLMGMMFVHTILFWKLVNLFWSNNHPVLAKVSSAIFVSLTSLPLLEGLIVNAELLMMLPVTAMLLIVWQERADTRVNPYRFLIAGLVAGLGWLYKIPVVFDFAAIALYLFVFRAETLWESIKNIFSKNFWMMIVGFVTPLSLTFIYYFLKGDGVDYLGTVLTMNLGYVSSWTTSSYTFNPLRSGLVVRGLILSGFTLFIYLLRKKMDRRVILASLWTGWALFGALLSYRPYPHYLQEVVPAFALLLPTIFLAKRVAEWLVIGIIVGIGMVVQWQVKFWGYETIGVYKNFWQVFTKKITQEEYRNKFDNARRNYTIANYLNERLSREDEIFVWGNDPTVYNLTNRLPTGGKYIVNFHVKDLGKYEYVINNLEKNKPQAIVVIPQKIEFLGLESLIEREYISVFEYDGSRIFWRHKML